MRKFRGQINGTVFTDQQEFEKAYKDFYRTANPDDSVNVSYTIETVEDEKQPEEELRKTIPGCSEKDAEILCGTADAIRSVVDETATKIQSYIDACAQDYHSTHELESIVDAALMKIDWLVQQLPGNIRTILCNSIHGATEEMVDKINTELVDMRYEIAKEQELITDEIKEFDDDLKEIDAQMMKLDDEKNKVYNEISKRQDEYNTNDTKINTISVAKKFFDCLLDSFSL